MAKYSKIYNNGIEKHEVVFRGKVFDFSMLPTRGGTKSNKANFSSQISQEFPDILSEKLKLSGVDELWCETDTETIFEILEYVSSLEN